MSDRELSCRELVELVSGYLDDDMAPDERARFERHLDDCPGCVVYLDQMRRTIAAAGRLSGPHDPRVQESLMNAFRDRRA